jgi:predicted component of type VI protein secretion system
VDQSGNPPNARPLAKRETQPLGVVQENDAYMTKPLPDAGSKRKLIERLVSFFSPKVTQPLVADKIKPQAQAPEPAAPYRSDLKNPSVFPEGSSLLFRVVGHKVLVETPELDILLGRFTEHTQTKHNVHTVNLAEYAGYQTGVSRLHALVRPTANNRLLFIDLGSTNGSFLNGQPLQAFKGYYLQDGDEIRLGDLPLHVYILYP